MSLRILLLVLGLVSLGSTTFAQTLVQNRTYATGQNDPVSDPTTIDANTAVLVPSMATVVYQAGTRITLGPGFTAALGSSFHALIGAASGGDTQAPTAPTGLAGNPSTSSVTLTWNAATDNVLVTGYRVYRVGSLVPLGTTAVLTFTHLGLTANTAYSYTVVAYDAAGNVSPPSSVITVTTGDPEPPDPNNPTKLNIHIPISP